MMNVGTEGVLSRLWRLRLVWKNQRLDKWLNITRASARTANTHSRSADLDVVAAAASRQTLSFHFCFVIIINSGKMAFGSTDSAAFAGNEFFIAFCAIILRQRDADRRARVSFLRPLAKCCNLGVYLISKSRNHITADSFLNSFWL